MSSWERSRFVPWDRIPLPDTRPREPGEPPPVDLDTAKERIFRQLQREAAAAAEEETRAAATTGIHATDAEAAHQEGGLSSSSSSLSAKVKVPYTHMGLFKSAAFGGTIGAITGGVFGFMDGMRTAGESPVLQKASNMAKGRYLLQGSTRSAALFGMFFGGFHVLKYGLRVTVDPGDYNEIFIVSPVVLGALFYKPATRQAMPYASMLILMDGVNMYMRKTD